MKHLGSVALLICLIATPLAAWAGSPKSLEENLRAAGRFTTYLELQKLAAPGKSGKAMLARTFLVPNDAAFAKLPPEVLEKLKHNPALARKFLDSHTLPGRVTVDDMVGPGRSKSHQIKSDLGDTLTFRPATTEEAAAPVPVPAPEAPAAPAPVAATTPAPAPSANISQIQAVDLGMYPIPTIVISSASSSTTDRVERAPLEVTGRESAVFKVVQIVGAQPALTGGGTAYELQSSLYSLYNQSWMSNL